MSRCGIYKITCTNTGKFYIGSSKDIEERWYHHKYDLIKSEHHSVHLQRAVNKYGIDALCFEVLEECDMSVKDEREQFYLDTLRPYDRDIGYNICSVVGNTVGVSPSRETRQKIAAVSRRTWQKPGHRDKMSKKISANTTSQWATKRDKMVESLNREETKQKKQVAALNMWQDPEYREKNLAARPPVDREKRSAASTLAWSDPAKRQAAVLSSPIRREIRCNETGVIYASIAKAAKALGVAVKSIKKATNPGRTCKGHTFSYVEANQ